MPIILRMPTERDAKKGGKGHPAVERATPGLPPDAAEEKAGASAIDQWVKLGDIALASQQSRKKA